MTLRRSYLYGLLPIIAAVVTLASPARAQGRLFDKVVVTLPANVKVGGQTLPGGEYTIRQLHSQGAGARVVLVNDDGSQYDASVVSIPAAKAFPPAKTQVSLRRIGSDYYLDHMWIAGKKYGYEFPLPLEARSRLQELNQSYTLSASYSAPPAQQQAEVQEQAQVQQQTQAAPPPPAPQQEVAQAAPPPQQPAATPAPEQPAPPPAKQELPRTASDSFLLLLCGMALMGAGTLLRVNSKRV